MGKKGLANKAAELGVNWQQVEQDYAHGFIVKAFNDVLDRGTPDDLGKMLCECQTTPESFSASLLNKVCDMISLLLVQGEPRYVETALLFILKVTRMERGGQKALQLFSRTKSGLAEALGLLANPHADIPSKQSVLAGLLQTQLLRR